MSKTCIILGGGGHACGLVEILQSRGECILYGVLDANSGTKMTDLCGAPILGDDSLLKALTLQKKVDSFVVGLGGVGNNAPRRRLYEMAVDLGLEPLSVIHQTAVHSPSATLGAGIQLLALSVIGSRAIIGNNVIVNTSAIVEHDCCIGSHVHIATGARLASTVTVGDFAHIGVGATIRQGITVGTGAIVGAGAVVVKDVHEGDTVVGVPSRSLRN